MTHESTPAGDGDLREELHVDGSYKLLQTLTAGQSFLCSDASSNLVVLKRLEPDCLHGDQIHPSIKHRLSRIREVAHPGIAVLRAVQHYEGVPCMVWMYLDGQSWEQAMDNSSEDRPRLCRELAAAAARLHENGIVHGSLHPRNIIVRPGGQVWLTHLSPYLYTDPQADVQALIPLMRGALAERSDFSPISLSHLESQFQLLEAGQISLRDFSQWLVMQSDRSDTDAVAQTIEPHRRNRAVSLALAGLLLGAAALGWWELRRFGEEWLSHSTAVSPPPMVVGTQH